jgi:hypothetical protein
MSKQIDYTCNKCGHQFIGTEFHYQCTNCYSEDTKAKKDAFNPKIRKKSIIIFAGIAILILILIKICTNPPCPEVLNFRYSIQLDSSEVGYKIIIQVKPLGTSDEKNCNNAMEKPKLKSVVNAENSAHIIEFDKKTNLLKLCPDKDFNILKVDFYHNGMLNSEKIPVKINLQHPTIVNNGNCPIHPEPSDFILTRNSNDCTYKLDLSQGGKSKGLNLKTFKISVTGKDGPYLENVPIPVTDFGKVFKVFLYSGTDSTEFIENGSPVDGCKKLDREQIQNYATTVLKRYLSQPTTRDNRHSFRELNRMYDVKIYLNSNPVDMVFFENKIEVDYENTSSVKYQLIDVKISDKVNTIQIVVKINTK